MDQRYLTQMDEQSTLPKTKLVSRLQLGPENTEIPHMVEGRYIMHEQAVNIEENSSSLPSSVEKYPTALRTAVYRTGTERKHKTTVKEGKMGFEYVLSRKLRESPERAQCETMISLELKSDIGKKHSMIPVHEEVQHVVGTSASSSIDSEGKYNKHKLKMAEKEDDNKETELQTVVSEPSCHTKICKQQKAGTSHNKPIREKVYSYDRTEPTDDDVIKHILRLRGKLGWQTILPPRGYIAEETKATIIQKIALRRPLLLKDSGEYIYCLRRSRNNPKAPYNPYDLQVVSANSARHNKEYWTITASFVSKFSVVHKAEEMEIIPVMEWLCERQLYYMICNFNVFSNVRMKKYFFTWKINVRRAKTTKSKTMMYNQLFLADELFLSCLLYIQGLCEDACNINCCKGSEDNAIYLIKVDRFRTYSLDEFCEEQYQQNKEALHQLQTFREKVIKAIQSTFLRVAEMKGAQKLFQSVPSDSKENPKYAEISEWRQMMKRFSRFLLLVDKIFQELLRKLVHNAVQLLLELFKGSSNVINPDEKKNENLMSIYKNTLVRLSGLLDAEYCSVGVSKEFIRDFERAPQEPSFHSREDKVLKPEIITVADIDKVLEDVKKQLEGEQEYAPVFEVNIGLRIPFEKINDRGSHQEDDPESCEMQDDDSFSLTSVEFLKQRLKDDDNLKSWTQSKSKRAYEELSENTKKQTFKLSQGKTDLSACKGEVKPESDNKAELKHECSSSFCTDIFLIPNRRQFSKKLQGIVDGLENTTAQVIPFSRDTHLSIFITQSLHKIMQSPESCTELWEKEYPAPWPNWELLLGTDPCYQNKILTLLSILSSSMEQVESYSRNFMRYCAMVNEAKTMNMEILALQRELSSHDFRGILNKYTDDVNKIICMTIERRIHMIKVRSVNYQTDCLPYFEALLNIIRSSLYAIVEAKNLHLSEVIHSALRKLDKDLTTVEEFIEHLTFLSQISSELPMLETQYNTLSQLYSIARAYDFFIPAEQFALYQILTRSLHDLKSSILICEKVKNDNIIKFSADLDGYFGNLQFELRNFKNKVRNPVLLLSKTSPKTAKEMIQSLVEEAAVISNKSRSYANYQDLFDSSIADMRSLSLERVSQKSQVGDSSSQRVNKELSKIESELSLRKLLWDLLEEWGKLSFRWKHTLFENIDVDLIQKDVNRFMQTIQILEKGLPENNIIIGLKQSLTDFKEGLSVIVFLRSPYLQPRHWEAIQYIIGQSISWDKKFTLENVLQLNLFQYEKEITDVSVTATNEATLEIMLNKIINLWNKTNFHLSPHRSETSTFMIISSAEDIMAQLEESQVTISTIKGSCYVGPIKNLVDAWDHKLNLFSRTLEEWLTCQRNWIYLEPIFHAPEIQRQLPAEASIFSQVNNKWKEIMACTEDNPNALRAATTAGVLEMLQTNNAHLEKIQKSLEDYLEIKRMIFPRFYFLSNAELLDILAESKNPEAVQPHLVKCFANIRKLYIRRHDQKSPVVVMIGSAEEETLLVPKIIRIRGPVEQWLGNIESSMFDMVKKFVNIGMVEWNQMEFKQWFLTHPGQVVLLVSQIMFNKDCTRSFQSSDPKMALTGIHDELVRHLEQLAEMASDILQFHKQTTLEALLTLYIHCRDILSSLIDKQIFKREDFEWTRQLRYEWNEMNTTCRVVQGNASFIYGYEYLGCSSRLVITPLTDRCWLTLTGALHLNLGGCPAGPAGTGKTETVKDLSKAMGKLCVVFNCFEGLDYQMMGKFFCGLVQSGTWCCFDEFNRIDIEVLSVIASQIQTIKAAKDSHVIRFVLEGKEIRINTSCGIFITMNPGYKGRVELPDNLKSLFRPVSMMVPDYQLIAEVILFSEGFKSAKSLSGKLVNLYQLACNQLSQQDHYDFGMRAIKTVLLRAGQKKKELKIQNYETSVPAEEETLIIINSLKEANLPKFLAEDVPLFENIMADLFPGITVPRVSTHKLEKSVAVAMQQLGLQPWASQIEKVLQFHNQILARVGVMLVGPTGGGKTTVRTILEKALVILPTLCLEKISKNDAVLQNAPKKGKVDTFVINPKCVSVGELYGQTDPNTMEWSDGLLASAVRTFAKHSTKKSKKMEANTDAATRIQDAYTLNTMDLTDTAVTAKHKVTESSYSHSKTITDWQWIILDGPVDTVWIENLNTVLDDTRTLCLANSERIYLPSGIRMIFETDSLSQASPATVSRCAMVFVDPSNLGWEPYVKTWLLKASRIITQSGSECLERLFEKSIKKGLNFLHKHKKMQPFPVQQMGIIMNLCRILGAFIDIMSKNGLFCHSVEHQDSVAGTSKVEAKALTAKASVEKKREDQKWFLEKYPDKLPSLLEKLYVFAFTWAVGGVLRRETDYEEESLIGINTKDESLVTVTRGFSNFVRDIFEGESPIGIQFPAGDRVIFEYFVDLQTGDFAPWTDLVPTTQFLIQQETTSFSDSLRSGSNKDVNLGRRDTLKLIPNMETICYSFLTSLLLMNKHPVLITGDSGIGKTAMIQNMLERLQNQGGLFVKSGTILGDVVLHNEIKKASMLKNSSYLTFDMPKGAQKRVWPSPGDSDLKSTTGPYSASETGDIALTSERIKGVIVSTIQCGAHTSAAQIQSWIHQKLILKSKDVLGAPKSKQVIMFIDDLNMPIPEEYGAQPPLETIRQFLDLGGFYDTKQLAWRNIQDVSLVADCAPPSGGRNEISPRLLTHFCLLVLPQPSLQSLQRIFQVNLGTYLYNNRFLSEVQKCSDFLTSSSIAVYYSVCRSMLPTPAKCHYTFNLRDLFKVLQGLLQAHRSVIVSNETAALLFVHETTRVFHDRLIESAEREIFYQFLANELHNYFKITWTKEKLMEESTIFVDFLDMNTPLENKIYRNITNYKKLVSVLEEFQTKMNSTNTKTSMVFFKEAVEHTTRAARVFRQPGGHMMLIGLDGNGKITCATLACYLANCSLFRLSVTHSYSYTDFIEDLKRVYRQTGLEGQNTVLLITDSDIVQDSFLEHLSCILNSGEVLDLFDKEELEGIVVKLTAVAEKADYSNSREAILSFFMQRVRSKLHIVLATSPAGLNFRQLCRIYPSIVNCSTIDWYDNWPEEALLHVAKIYFSHEDICDDSENLTNTVAQVCVEIHKSASTTTEKYLKETKRHYYITPNSYLQFIDTFSSILQSTKKKSLFNRACFYNGLTKLLEATSLVAEMQEELLTLGPQIEQKSKEIEELVEKLHRDSQVVEQVRTLVKQDEEIMAEETKVVEEYARQATEELNAVLPALEKALAALDALDKAHIAELRVYTHPPPLVLTVMNAVCILLQKKPSWATAKLLLADAGFLKKLVTLDKDNLPEKVFLQLKRYVRSPDFSPSKVGLVSIACCSMCHWILALDHYHEVQKLVKPKEIRVTEAQEVLRLAHQKLDEKQRSLALIEEHEQNLEASYQESIAQKEMLATRKQLATQRLHRASILSTALADEMERWKESVNNLDERLQGIMGDALVSAACIIYSGVLSAEYRQQLINECLRLCNENIIPVSPNYSLITAMTEKNEISKWQNEGLPLDQYSIENAILVKYGQRWPLLIDPQKQAYRWICQMEGNRLRQIHASDSNYLRTLENAMRIGDSILLQDLAETLDSNLKPILRKEIYSTGGKDFIRIGDAEIEYNHNFRLYITTQKANPHFLPSVCNVVTMINFTVTFQGLQDQLLSTVVIHETPQLEQQRCELLESISADQITLRELEQKSLKLLQKTEGHILDDQDLIDNLQRTKVTSKEIFERVEASAKTEAAIEKTRKNYLPIATRGAVLYFVVADLIKINYMYQFSLEWFHKIFVESMDLVNKLQSQISLSESTSSVCGTVRALSRQRKRHFTQEHWEECENETDSFNRHLKDIIDMLTNNVYKIMQNNCGENQPQDNLGFLSENEWNFFLYSSMLANIMDTQSEFENYGSYMFNKTPHLWITESMWKECQYMSTHMQPFNLLCDSLASNSQQWSSFLNSGNLYYLLSTQYRPTSSQQDTDLQSDALKERIGLDSAVVDFHWENLSSFQRIILIKILRPGSLNSAIREFVIEKLGASYLQTGGINLKEVYEDSSAATPLIFIHSHGIDPAAHLLRLAQEIKGSTRHVQMVSLGRGQGSKAEDLIHKAQLLSGQWVFLQNCHLAASFMPRLCTIVDSFTQPNINMDPQFRLWLSSTPDPSFPIPILQKGFKMAIEPPRGLKGKLLQTFGYSGSGDVTEIIFNKVECGLSWKKLVFSLCFFNAVVHERKKYGSLGWNVPYEFNSSDLEVSIQMLGMLLANQEEIPWQAICYLTGEVVYGGRVTDHWDRRCLLSILNNFYSPVVLQEGFAYSSDGVYRPVSATDSLQDCRAYLESLPDTDSPELFGMHACAGRAFLESQAQTFIDTIVSMQPGISMDTLIISGGKSQDELVLEIASDILRQLPLTIEEQDTELTPGTERSSKMKITLGSLLSGPIWAALAKAAKGHDPFINSALLTVLRQEIDRFNNLLSVITISLHSLQQAMKGEIIFTTGLEDLYNSVLKSKVPEFWQLYSYMSNKSLGSWIDDLILRVNFFATWANQVITCIQLRYNSLMLLQKQAKTSGISFSSPTGDRSNISTNSIQGNPSRFWLSGFFSPQGFLTAVLQNYARQNGISVDSLTFGHRLLPTIHDEDCNLREVKRKQNIIQTAFKESSPPENGVLVFGLYIDGARWSTTTHVLEEPFLHDRFYPLPEIVFLPQQIIQTRHTCPDEEQGELMHYECPLYRTPQRAGILLSTGLSTNFVTTVSLPTKRTSSHWVTRGVAMLCQLDD
ncbi:dynein heavy chain 14, axonemal isoform X4 [Mauremys reevesii]|uniref:dynein heavy chain 14, axonemal isoform X4 n=1 Tax=Mauremys reevesii TaxID=260615 RepID=UPI00193FB06E|nr:dynein heavy chain 14, axonemal isoform X4 [Mauremys reevesii]